MRYTPRLLVATGVAAFIPLALLGFGARWEVTRRLEADYHRRVREGLVTVLAALEAEAEAVGARLAGVRRAAADDNALRLALVAGAVDRPLVIDYAGAAMRLAGLDALELRSDAGVVLSSGQFRSRYGARDTTLLPLLDSVDAPILLLRTRRADGPLLLAARWDSLTIAGRRYHLLGGREVDRRALASIIPGAEAYLAIAMPGSAGAESQGDPPGFVTDTTSLPLIDATDGAILTSAGLRLAVSRAPLQEVLRGLDRWFLAALALSAAAALLSATIAARRMSRPIRALAAEAERVDLDRPRLDFGAGQDDEIGTLGSVMDDMVRRLGASAERLKDAERRATAGDLSRQLSHDIKNGLTPIRNILAHLDKVARASPDRLAGVFAERRPTLDSSLAYLEDLARRYAGRTLDLTQGRSDLRPLLEEVVRERSAGGVEIRLALPPALPVAGDAVALRRIFDNLVGNACDGVAANGGTGAVEVSADPPSASYGRFVRVVVADTGPGMSDRELQRAFAETPSAKAGGTGLGLSIVRRLVLECGGGLRVETAPGRGTRVLVDLLVANEGDRE